MTRLISSDAQVDRKIRRLANGAAPRVLDLFSGCGGLSLGFQRAGFEISAAVELDPEAAASHGLNFHPGDEKHAQPRNILQLSPERLAASLGLGPPGLAFDVLVGGPPCQAFARVGRPKLREIQAHPEAFRLDPRSRLYLEYLHYVRVLKPLAVLMENVPDVLNHGDQNVAEETCEALEREGYVTGYTLLNAAHYGVPQMRERMLLVAYRSEIADAVVFPSPTHRMELPAGYANSRSFALRLVNAARKQGLRTRFKDTPSAAGSEPAVTAQAALADLPVLTDHLNGDGRRVVSDMAGIRAYRDGVEPSIYAQVMRTWMSDDTVGTTSHVVRRLPRDYAIFRRMAAGEQYPQAHEHAQALFREALDALATPPHEGTKTWDDMRARYVPPYDTEKFPNKWRKMEPDKPARTLMAHLGKDSYSHIHYDSEQARTISVREAARLQSFPDGFQFAGAMNAAFRQIGNAVPPVLAAALAEALKGQLMSGVVDARHETGLVAHG